MSVAVLLLVWRRLGPGQSSAIKVKGICGDAGQHFLQKTGTLLLDVVEVVLQQILDLLSLLLVEEKVLRVVQATGGGLQDALLAPDKLLQNGLKLSDRNFLVELQPAASAFREL